MNSKKKILTPIMSFGSRRMGKGNRKARKMTFPSSLHYLSKHTLRTTGETFYLWQTGKYEHQLCSFSGQLVKEWESISLPEIQEQLSIDYEET